jgi:hypothetical protein
VIADYIVRLLPAAAVVVYVVEDQDNPSWTPKATAGAVYPFREGWRTAVNNDERAAAYVGQENGVGNLWMQPISGGSPHQNYPLSR